ncbi:hypothetical protein Fmac_005717 [Flemingia macrophylla]|uniref:Uncharacterized protein n=1 Tax=Flemingia macrophylla TaxID=520843 RepID=A0ABD1N9M4_9FABA
MDGASLHTGGSIPHRLHWKRMRQEKEKLQMRQELNDTKKELQATKNQVSSPFSAPLRSSGAFAGKACVSIGRQYVMRVQVKTSYGRSLIIRRESRDSSSVKAHPIYEVLQAREAIE